MHVFKKSKRINFELTIVERESALRQQLANVLENLRQLSLPFDREIFRCKTGNSDTSYPHLHRQL